MAHCFCCSERYDAGAKDAILARQKNHMEKQPLLRIINGTNRIPWANRKKLINRQ
ncbi:hypothetical protein SAMN05216420_101159 [Nitrosospira sp. Nl5]|nr:hypothetical protein SAMN05216420_101159 [Nitrosospira sp. Nl5]